MTGIWDLFPDDATISKASLRLHLAGPVANIQGFGARGDGHNDDTRAIQAAIDSLAAKDGGTVYIPAGTYKIMPQGDAPANGERNAITIQSDNIRIVGDGPGITKLVFRLSGDRDPSNNFDVIISEGKPIVWRGSAIAILGTNSVLRPRHNISIESLEIDGGAYPGNTGDRTWPVPVETGAGWDITHKGIFIVPDLAYRGLYFSRLHIHNFRGEIIYGGGRDIEDVVVEKCTLHSTNADGLSISASQVVRKNTVYDCAHACVESFHFAKEARYTGNNFSAARLGICMQTNWDSKSPAIISQNTFTECRNQAILFNVENGPTLISDNIIVDCGYEETSNSSISIGTGEGLSAPITTGISIRNNTILRQRRGGGFGIYLSCDNGGKLKSIDVGNNYIGSSGLAVQNNFRFLAPIAYAFVGKADVSGVAISRNIFFRTQRAIENTVSHLPSAATPMPLMWDNRTIEISDAANSWLTTDGKTPIRLNNAEPISLSGQSDGTVTTPILVPTDYVSRQQIVLTGDNASHRIYIPQSSDIYECVEGRFLFPGVFLTLERIGNKFAEVKFIDRRVNHYAEIAEGPVIDAKGYATVYLTVPNGSRMTAFEGIGHGAELRLIANSDKITIVHNDAIQLSSGSDYLMSVNEMKMFYRGRDGVLREM